MTNAPHFERFVDLIYKRAPLQKKKLEKHFSSQSELFFKEAELFSAQYIDYLESQRIVPDYAVGAYLKMCNDMMRCQVGFMKTGEYPVKQATDALENVYNNETEMQSYMIGLALSQFLWSSHYAIFTFFKDALKKLSPSAHSYLEIGPGHGLFLSQAMKLLKECRKFVTVDISATSIQITKSIMQHIFPGEADKVVYHINDMLDLSLEEKYDFISMGEVIEHVNFPDKLLEKLKDLLTPEGKGFVSTCVDCPATDHVYHFRSVDEIRDLISKCGLSIVDERVCPVEDLPMEEIVRRKITINYCCIVERA
jgi:2-polyprenyl-3-methyl-5-hydroxy-6-metoxy-1,4-benzoquinol methylase